MIVLVAVVAGILGLAAVLLLAVAVFAARSLVIGSTPRPISYKVAGERIELVPTELTRAPGSYGLITPDGIHARVDAVLEEADTALTRALGVVTGGQLPPEGIGRWVRDVYPSPAALGLSFEEVEIATAGGTSPAWVVPGDAEGDIWAIHLHGIRTTRSVVLPGVAALRPAGVTSLVPSWRGDTEGPATFSGGSTLGQEEWRDVEAALEYAVARGARSIVLVGWSMGAMISSLLLQNSPLADRVVALVMVAPVTSWRLVLAKAVRAARLPKVVGWLVAAILRAPVLCRVAGLAVPVKLAAFDAATLRASVPTLVIHNPGDHLSPFASTVDFQSRNDELVELVVFEDAPHAMEWNREPDRFEATVGNWVANVVARERA